MSAGEEIEELKLGRIVRAQGVLGAVKVALYFAQSQALRGEDFRLTLPNGTQREVRLAWANPAGKEWIVKFEGVDSRADADALRNAVLSCARESLPPLAGGEYYLVDLIGAQVIGPEGPLGEVVDVRVYPSVDVIVVRGADGSLAEQPLSAPWIEQVDAARKIVTLARSDGLIR